MAWVYLDDQFPDHPKVAAAGGDAAWLFVCGLAYVKRYNTEGTIPKAQVARLSDRKQPGRLAARLVDVGLWEDHGDVYKVHDYHEWNRSGEARTAAAKKAARARWRNGKEPAEDAPPPPTVPPPEHPPDDANAMRTHSESHSDTHSGRNANGDASTCPLPLPPTEDLTSSYGLTTRADPPDDDDPDRQPLAHQALVGATVALLAERDLQERQRQAHLPPIGNTQRWVEQAQDQRRQRHGPHIARLAGEHPRISPTELADLVDPPPTTPDEPAAPPLRPIADVLNLPDHLPPIDRKNDLIGPARAALGPQPGDPAA